MSTKEADLDIESQSPNVAMQGDPESRDLEPPEIQVEDFERPVSTHTREFTRQSGNKVIVLSFRALQLKRIVELQDQLLPYDIQNRMLEMGMLTRNDEGYNPALEVDDKLDSLLEKYATALRNFDIFSQNSLSGVPSKYDFVGDAEKTGIDAVFNIVEGARQDVPGKILDAFKTFYYKHLCWGSRKSKWEQRRAQDNRLVGIVMATGFRELDKAGREERQRREAQSLRLAMALFGGVALITPMLIMSLRQSLDVALITTSVATVLFGVLIALGSRDSEPKDVLGATAAYAAVLVVFVGASLALL